MFKLHHDQRENILEFAHKFRSAFLKVEKHGDCFSDYRKGQMFMEKVHWPTHIKDLVLGKAGGRKDFSLIYDAIHELTLGNRQTTRSYFDADNSSCLLYTSPSPRDRTRSRMPSSA